MVSHIRGVGPEKKPVAQEKLKIFQRGLYKGKAPGLRARGFVLLVPPLLFNRLLVCSNGGIPVEPESQPSL